MRSDMGKRLAGLLAVLAVGLAGEAHAQFANRSLGGGVSFIKLFGGNSRAGVTGVDFAVPLTLEGSLYIENGFDIYAHVPVMLVSVTAGADTPDGRGLIFGSGGHLGVRFLFAEETLRPYVGIEVAGFVLLAKTTVVFIGPGATVGLDYFVADTISIGARAFFDLFIELNVDPRPAVGGGIAAAAYF